MSNHDSQKIETKKKIKKALVSLLSEKEFDSISVSSVCSRAHIHRSTFYSHYENIEMIIDDVLNDCNQIYIKNYPSISNMSRLEQSCFWLETIRNGEMLVPVLITNKDKLSLIVQRFENSESTDKLIRDSVFSFLFNHGICFDENTAYQFYSSMIFSIIYQWILTDFAAPTKEVAKFICALIGIEENENIKIF